MLINCKNCNKKFLIDKSELDLEGSLITCKHCNKEWIFESRTHFLEKKLAELDNDLKQKEIHLTEQNDNHNIRIEALEKDLVNKKIDLIELNTDDIAITRALILSKLIETIKE